MQSSQILVQVFYDETPAVAFTSARNLKQLLLIALTTLLNNHFGLPITRAMSQCPFPNASGINKRSLSQSRREERGGHIHSC
jgi:hypothetical protein